MLTKILVGTNDGLYELRDSMKVQLAGHDLTGIGKDASGLWAIVDGSEVWHSASEGDWKQIASFDTLKATAYCSRYPEFLSGPRRPICLP